MIIYVCILMRLCACLCFLFSPSLMCGHQPTRFFWVSALAQPTPAHLLRLAQVSWPPREGGYGLGRPWMGHLLYIYR